MFKGRDMQHIIKDKVCVDGDRDFEGVYKSFPIRQIDPRLIMKIKGIG